MWVWTLKNIAPCYFIAKPSLASWFFFTGSSYPVFSFIPPPYSSSMIENLIAPSRHSCSKASSDNFPSEWSDVHRNSYVFSSNHVLSLIPKLTSTSHKGSHGRIGIFGGSEKYTGAPYYAASAALNCGVDLVTVFCAKEACLPIKCYSPELMVQGVYSVEELDGFEREGAEISGISDEDNSKLLEARKKTITAVTDTFPSLHALCIGPGLGRHRLLFPAVSSIIQKAIECNLPLILDADALYMLSLDEHKDLLLELIKYENVVMTPNLMEFKRLKSALQTDNNGENDPLYVNGIIVQKGHNDIITQGTMKLECREQGGLKRSGGIGDVLAGTICAFMAWNKILQNKTNENRILATWTACCTVKKATFKAFEHKRRSMSAQHVLEEVPIAVQEMEDDLSRRQK